ncbi:MAG: hypothetical protein KC620_13925 [Myxococcales bacterium]|nr:hypothetical protein [Myxococcales bacterium]
MTPAGTPSGSEAVADHGPSADVVCRHCGRRQPYAALGRRCPFDGSLLLPPRGVWRVAVGPLTGEVLIDRFAVGAAVARSGALTLYRGIDRRDGRSVLVKVVAASADCAAIAGQRLADDARFFEAGQIEGFAPLLADGCDHAGNLFVVLGIAGGRPMPQLVRESGPLPALRAGRIAIALLAQLDALHGAGLAHGELLSESIVVHGGPDGTPEVSLTTAGAQISTDEPGLGALGVAGDLFAVALLVYEMLLGRPVDAADAARDLKLLGARALTATMRDQPATAEVVEVVCRALGPEPRFASAAEMRQAFEAALAGGRRSLAVVAA